MAVNHPELPPNFPLKRIVEDGEPTGWIDNTQTCGCLFLEESCALERKLVASLASKLWCDEISKRREGHAASPLEILAQKSKSDIEWYKAFNSWVLEPFDLAISWEKWGDNAD